jgi:hypothetical protein
LAAPRLRLQRPAPSAPLHGHRKNDRKMPSADSENCLPEGLCITSLKQTSDFVQKTSDFVQKTSDFVLSKSDFIFGKSKLFIHSTVKIALKPPIFHRETALVKKCKRASPADKNSSIAGHPASFF